MRLHGRKRVGAESATAIGRLPYALLLVFLLDCLGRFRPVRLFLLLQVLHGLLPLLWAENVAQIGNF